VTDIASNSNSVFVIDTATNTVIATIPVGLFPLSIAITPDGTRAYVTNSNSGTISVIDTATNSVIATIPVGLPIFDIAFTPDGTRAYASSEQGSNRAIIVIDTATNAVITTIPVLGFPFRIAISPAPRSPKNKEECKNGGWRNFGPPAGPFKNQGQCVSSVERSATRPYGCLRDRSKVGTEITSNAVRCGQWVFKRQPNTTCHQV
jgi:YVTN family beta-propeller protein